MPASSFRILIDEISKLRMTAFKHLVNTKRLNESGVPHKRSIEKNELLASTEQLGKIIILNSVTAQPQTLKLI